METLYRIYNRLVEQADFPHHRYLYHRIDWNDRLICIKGARGVGKTSLLLQHIKQDFPNRSRALYVSLDNIWFTGHTLLELTEYHYTHGGTHLFLDEVHRYPGWIREVKNIYDSYPDLFVVFTGSSLLELDYAEADLSRRLRMYMLQGLSFREYLQFNDVMNMPPLSLMELLDNHVQKASEITAKVKVLPYFERYIRGGYYPFHLIMSEEGYMERVQRVINTIVENDIPSVEPVEYGTIIKIKRLLAQLSRMVPFEVNVSTLCETIGVTRNQLLKLMALLERSALIRQLFAEGKGLRTMLKPDKIVFNNPNLLACLTDNPNIGSMRESFFVDMVGRSHEMAYPKQGDVKVDNRWIFEIGGKGKSFAQIRDVADSFVVADGIEIGFGNKIPLWMFGLLY